MHLLRVQSFCIISLVCIFSSLAEAKDIGTLQTASSLARENMEQAKLNHETNVQAVTQQQQIVAQLKKRLAEESSRLDQMQKDTKQALEQYLEAQRKYEKAQSNLDEAWGTK